MIVDLKPRLRIFTKHKEGSNLFGASLNGVCIIGITRGKGYYYSSASLEGMTWIKEEGLNEVSRLDYPVRYYPGIGDGAKQQEIFQALRDQGNTVEPMDLLSF